MLFWFLLFATMFLSVCYFYSQKPALSNFGHKITKNISYMQINNVRARLFCPNVSIFTHFFLICAHAYTKKAVILQRELLFLNVVLLE